MGHKRASRLYSEPCCNCLLSLRNWYVPRWGGSSQKQILFINDIPSIIEYKTQTHYTGRSSKILNHFIDEYKLTEFCSKTHLIKCYNPKAEHKYAKKCVQNIIKDLVDLKPSIIVSCGKLVYETLTDKEHINMHTIVNRPIRFANSILIPIFSPAYIRKSNKIEEYEKSFKLISDIFARINNSYANYR